MKHIDQWRASKFVLVRGRLRASPKPARVKLGSRITADLQASLYQRLIEQHARGSLLDLGCGSVPLYGVYRDLVEDVTCVDWPQCQHWQKHVDLFHDLNEPLPLQDASYDTILLTDVMEHIGDPQQLWREIARLLRPDGRLILTVPFMYLLHEVPHDYYRYTAHALQRHAEQAGLVIQTLESYGGSPEVVADIVAKHLQAVPPVCRVYVPMAKLLLQLPPVRAISKRTRPVYPLGYAVVARRPAVSAARAA